MQILSLDIIGTHLQISIDTPHTCDEVFSDIRIRLQDFEMKYSRFIEGNWLYDLNTSRKAILDSDGKKMLTYMLQISRETDGYFDPTIGKRLTELGYGNPEVQVESTKYTAGYGDYRDIEVVGDTVILHGDIMLEFGGVGKGYLIDVIVGMLEWFFEENTCMTRIMEGDWCRFSPGKGGVRGGYTEYNPSLLKYAQENRKIANDMEKNMWFLLRGEKLRYKFHRQKPIGEYIVDFYSPSLQLAIEIDGESHVDNMQYDHTRTQYINSLGIHVLRFTNSELIGNLEGVQENLKNWIQKIEEHMSVTPPNLPFSGEGPRKYLINFGGDLYGKGGWTVGLESPFDSDEVIGTLSLDDHYLACSAGTRRKWGDHHHLIDPKTGESATGVIASYIEGISGMMADAYATTLCVMPWELARETLSKTPDISGVIVRYDGELYQKRGSRSGVFG